MKEHAVSALGTDISVQALRKAEAFNFALFQHNPLPTTIVDGDGRVLKSNLARRQSADPLPELGTPLFTDERVDGTNLQSALLDSIRSGRVHHFSEVDVSDRMLAITMAPFPQGAIVICEDITESKRATEQLIEAQKMAALGSFVAGVAHEISNPTNTLILGAPGLKRNVEAVLSEMERRADPCDRIAGRPYKDVRHEILEQIEVITRAGDRIRGFTGELKDFARRDEDVPAGPVDINAVAKSALLLMTPVLHGATHHFATEFADDIPMVTGNAGRLEQVVVNLLSNACQALTDGEQAISLSTAYDAGKAQVCLTVRDEGVGIDAEAMARLTDPFFTTKRDSGGTGLGLSVSSKIVAGHGGELVFESSPGAGTTVTIALPCPVAPSTQ